MTALPFPSHLTFSALNTCRDLWLFINLSAAADIHHPPLLCVCLSHSLSHANREVTERVPSGLTHCCSPGRLHGYVWRMGPLTISVLLLSFPQTTAVVVSLPYLSRKCMKIEENADASERPISGLSGALKLGRLSGHIIHFSCLSFNIKGNLGIKCWFCPGLMWESSKWSKSRSDWKGEP